MKVFITTVFVFASLFLISCGNGHQHSDSENNESEQITSEMYQCPMKCEGDKKYEEAGICPVCKMDLKLESEINGHEHHH